MRLILTRGADDLYRGFIAVTWFGIAQLLLAGFAIHLVSGWAADDGEGVLAAELSRPRHRWGIVLERAVLALAAIAVVAAIGSLAAAIAAAAFGTALDAPSVIRATWPLIPFGMTFAAAGAVGTVWWPRAAVGVLGLLTFAGFLLSELAPLLRWPDWVADLSVFPLYGTPLITGIFWSGLWATLAIVLVGFAAAVALMQRREVG